MPASNNELLLHTLYRPSVKITNWFVHGLSLPYDNADVLRTSHYKAFGVEKFTKPESVTKSTFVVAPPPKVPLESRFANGVPILPEVAPNADRIRNRVIQPDRTRRKLVMLSTYRRDFDIKMPKSNKRGCCEEPPDFLFNRIPINDFVMNPAAATKFMDDGVLNVTEGRRRINFGRQIRNQSLNIF